VSTLRDLATRVPRLDELCPEQIVCDGRGGTEAVLVDQWGRAHPLSRESSIGRDPGRVTIAVLEASISRRHAELLWAPRAARWMVNDLESTNGTFIEGKRLSEPAPLANLQLVTFGHVNFMFVADHRTFGTAVTEHGIRKTAPARDLTGDTRLRLVGPSQGGGGMAEYGAQSVQLGATQFALLRLLAERFLAEQAQPAEVRGFVRTVDLLAGLPWDTAHPDDNHAKQMVRRVRRQLERLGLPDLIESRHGFGYRLTSAPLLVGG
jgi:hypothetical protein